jgi:hypothetical protein
VLGTDIKGALLELKQWIAVVANTSGLSISISKKEDFLHAGCPWLLVKIETLECELTKRS